MAPITFLVLVAALVWLRFRGRHEDPLWTLVPEKSDVLQPMSWYISNQS